MSVPPSSRPAPLGLEELHALRWLLGGVLTLVSVGAVFYMDIDALGLALFAVASTLAGLIFPVWPTRVPRWVHAAAFPVILTFFAVDLWRGVELLPAIVRLGLWLLAYRQLAHRRRREDLQVVILGLFLIVVAGVLTVSLLFAVQLLAFTAVALGLLLVLTLLEGLEDPNVQGDPGAWARRLRWATVLQRLRETADWRVLALGAALFAGVVVLSGLLFLAIPRFQLQSGIFLDRFVTKKARTGFSETVRFGDVSEIQQDNGVALTIDVPAGVAIPATPYWRMLVLDNYDRGTFLLSQTVRSEFGLEQTGWQVRGALPAAGTPVYWTFYLEAGVSRYLPLPGRFAQLQFQDTKNYRVAADVGLVALREEPVAMTAYRVQDCELAAGLPDPRFRRLLRDESELARNRVAVVRRTSRLPADQQTLRRVVAEIANGERLDAGTFVERANAWLRRNHGYSLSPEIPDGAGDPLVRWLDSRAAGHCELFAGSLVLLARTAGFPSRLVTGFKGGAWNAFANSVTVRNADAHAWVEVFDEPSAIWLRADPLGVSAGSQADREVRGEAALAARADRSWAARLDSLRVFWYRRIVSFDQQAQLETLKSVKQVTEDTGRRLRASLVALMAEWRERLATPRGLASVAGGFVGVGVMMAALLVLRRRARDFWRHFRLRWRGGEALVRRDAGQLLARLAGRELPASERVIIDALQRLRFGARETWGDPTSVLRLARALAARGSG
jgi:transglutaminase-like putative cysteine protease